MNSIHVYLTFDGNCRQAMEFYRNCLGGELVFQTVGDSPLAVSMPPKMKDCILHASLVNDKIVMHASDLVHDDGLKKGNSISLMMNCNSEEELRKYYNKLSRGGKRVHAIKRTLWGALHGDLTDPYGNNWILHYPMNLS